MSFLSQLMKGSPGIWKKLWICPSMVGTLPLPHATMMGDGVVGTTLSQESLAAIGLSPSNTIHSPCLLPTTFTTLLVQPANPWVSSEHTAWGHVPTPGATCPLSQKSWTVATPGSPTTLPMMASDPIICTMAGGKPNAHHPGVLHTTAKESVSKSSETVQ